MFAPSQNNVLTMHCGTLTVVCLLQIYCIIFIPIHFKTISCYEIKKKKKHLLINVQYYYSFIQFYYRFIGSWVQGGYLKIFCSFDFRQLHKSTDWNSLKLYHLRLEKLLNQILSVSPTVSISFDCAEILCETFSQLQNVQFSINFKCIMNSMFNSWTRDFFCMAHTSK